MPETETKLSIVYTHTESERENKKCLSPHPLTEREIAAV